MQNLKNKKRLTILTIAFLLTFLVGAAFAFPPGNLEIEGWIGIGQDEMCVIWATAATSQSAAGVATTNVTRITSMSLGGGVFNPGHRIEWAIGFVNPGTVTLTATAINDGTVPVMIQAPVFNWGPFGDEGLTYTMDSTAFVGGPLAPGATTGDLIINITMPTGWINPLGAGIGPLHSSLDNWFEDQLDDDDYDLLTSFTVDIVYVVAP